MATDTKSKTPLKPGNGKLSPVLIGIIIAVITLTLLIIASLIFWRRRILRKRREALNPPFAKVEGYSTGTGIRASRASRTGLVGLAAPMGDSHSHTLEGGQYGYGNGQGYGHGGSASQDFDHEPVELDVYARPGEQAYTPIATGANELHLDDVHAHGLEHAKVHDHDNGLEYAHGTAPGAHGYGQVTEPNFNGNGNGSEGLQVTEYTPYHAPQSHDAATVAQGEAASYYSSATAATTTTGSASGAGAGAGGENAPQKYEPYRAV